MSVDGVRSTAYGDGSGTSALDVPGLHSSLSLTGLLTSHEGRESPRVDQTFPETDACWMDEPAQTDGRCSAEDMGVVDGEESSQAPPSQ
ncbi:hypothetical protein E4U55_002014 [Claviceps digitariae]|nr:hypothetical protein E4U55_002014 [Claviceps digitariae]